MTAKWGMGSCRITGAQERGGEWVGYNRRVGLFSEGP